MFFSRVRLTLALRLNDINGRIQLIQRILNDLSLLRSDLVHAFVLPETGSPFACVASVAGQCSTSATVEVIEACASR